MSETPTSAPPPERDLSRPEEWQRIARLLQHYARSLDTGVYTMPDSDLPYVLRRAASALNRAAVQR